MKEQLILNTALPQHLRLGPEEHVYLLPGEGADTVKVLQVSGLSWPLLVSADGEVVRHVSEQATGLLRKNAAGQSADVPCTLETEAQQQIEGDTEGTWTVREWTLPTETLRTGPHITVGWSGQPLIVSENEAVELLPSRRTKASRNFPVAYPIHVRVCRSGECGVLKGTLYTKHDEATFLPDEAHDETLLRVLGAADQMPENIEDLTEDQSYQFRGTDMGLNLKRHFGNVRNIRVFEDPHSGLCYTELKTLVDQKKDPSRVQIANLRVQHDAAEVVLKENVPSTYQNPFEQPPGLIAYGKVVVSTATPETEPDRSRKARPLTARNISFHGQSFDIVLDTHEHERSGSGMRYISDVVGRMLRLLSSQALNLANLPDATEADKEAFTQELRQARRGEREPRSVLNLVGHPMPFTARMHPTIPDVLLITQNGTTFASPVEYRNGMFVAGVYCTERKDGKAVALATIDPALKQWFAPPFELRRDLLRCPSQITEGTLSPTQLIAYEQQHETRHDEAVRMTFTPETHTYHLTVGTVTRPYTARKPSAQSEEGMLIESGRKVSVLIATKGSSAPGPFRRLTFNAPPKDAAEPLTLNLLTESFADLTDRGQTLHIAGHAEGVEPGRLTSVHRAESSQFALPRSGAERASGHMARDQLMWAAPTLWTERPAEVGGEGSAETTCADGTHLSLSWSGARGMITAYDQRGGTVAGTLEWTAGDPEATTLSLNAPDATALPGPLQNWVDAAWRMPGMQHLLRTLVADIYGQPCAYPAGIPSDTVAASALKWTGKDFRDQNGQDA